MDFEFWEQVAKLAPIGTASIALVAAIIALRSLYVQRDTARRRAAVDFFFKTEMDDKLVDLYFDFKTQVRNAAAIAGRPILKETDADYKTLTKWLTLCELIAVGVNLKAFSDKVAYDYWGYVIPQSFESARVFIKRVRTTPGLGGPKTYCELEKLARDWSARKDIFS